MNITQLTDSYKLSHFKQYPKDVAYVHSYMESRTNDALYFTGLDYYLDMLKAPTLNEVQHTAIYAYDHGVDFNLKGWEEIADLGYLPLEIRAVPEGITRGNIPLITVVNTDPRFFWLTNYIETLLLKVWYPINVATRSMQVRERIEAYYKKTGCDRSGVDFAFHNFGDRGSSSVESALIGGRAHLTQFKGTDNFDCICNGGEGYSIAASEHSTITSWPDEYDAIENLYRSNLDKPMVACVMDSFDIYKAVNFVTTSMKSLIEQQDTPIFVIRPDSGCPEEVVEKIVDILEKNDVAYTTNSMGFREWNNYRLIWGDGIDLFTIQSLLSLMKTRGYAASNIAFGSGGWLMQQHDRDTHKFAFKCSAVELTDGTVRDVFKNPVTDPGKKSKRGILSKDLKVVFKNGERT